MGVADDKISNQMEESEEEFILTEDRLTSLEDRVEELENVMMNPPVAQTPSDRESYDVYGELNTQVKKVGRATEMVGRLAKQVNIQEVAHNDLFGMILERFEKLEERFENVEENLEANRVSLEANRVSLEANRVSMNGRFEKLEERFENLDAKVQNLETTMNGRFDEILRLLQSQS